MKKVRTFHTPRNYGKYEEGQNVSHSRNYGKYEEGQNFLTPRNYVR